VQSADNPQTAFDSWRLLTQWLGHHWLGLMPATLLIGLVVWGTIRWSWLLSREWGRHWPVAAAILPALIPLARNWEENTATAVPGVTVGALLLAVAVLQLYGQKRNNNDRDQQAIIINSIATGVEQQGTELRRIATGVEQQGTELRRIAAGVEQQGTEVRRLADGITALASQVEEEADNEEEY
jgi:hypothetical protein